MTGDGCLEAHICTKITSYVSMLKFEAIGVLFDLLLLLFAIGLLLVMGIRSNAVFKSFGGVKFTIR